MNIVAAPKMNFLPATIGRALGLFYNSLWPTSTDVTSNGLPVCGRGLYAVITTFLSPLTVARTL